MKKYELAREDYEKGLKYREIAEKYGVSISTVKSWKSRYWSQEKVATMDATIPNNKGAPDRNKNAVKHGLFANWLPSETLEIINEVATSEPEDIIWNNIMIQYTAIIRAQKIMYVSGTEDLSKEVSKWSSSDSGSSEEYAIQYAWDKQANFLNAQSRAMSTLSNLIKQFVAIADEKDDRRKRLELMSAQIEKAVSDAAIAKNNADKLTAGGRTNDLLKALLDVKSGGNGDGNKVQSETD
ncbi:phage terminase small subunit [Enterococcus faecalis]|uniref:phage terminase small subunit n=1 Tax=Enterococcus faecalis TaxID=1351 RepID=UPI0025B114E6|nr:phage terminase small subunit [Enterococcus faecalis]MDN3074131.1 phage terminase small subunit [Enterococcus faecalis]